MQPTPPALPSALEPPSVIVNDAAFTALQQAQAQAAATQVEASVAEQIAQRGVEGQAARAAPRTAQEVAGLREQRSELGEQLRSAQQRRRDVARAVERADNATNRAGLEGRLRVLDQRIAQIETDISVTGRLITTAPPALFAGSETPFHLDVPDRGPPGTAVAIIAILFGVFPLVLALARRIMRRGVGSIRPDPLQRESAERLARLEQAVEAIAIEVERVSEGQRFVTRLLADSRERQAVPAQQNGVSDTLDAVGRLPG